MLDSIVRSIRAGTSLSAPEILKYLEDWEVLPGYVDGELAWTMVAKGCEVHFALAQDWHPQASMRGRIREFLKPKFDQLGFLTTRVLHSRPQQKKFVQRIGFKPTWRDPQVEYFMLTSLPFERKTR